MNVVVGSNRGSPRLMRLDRELAVRCHELSRSRLKTLILNGRVAIDGTPVRNPAYHPSPGETITIDIPPPILAEPAGEAIPLDIVYEDADMIVLNKPRGLVVHPAPGHETGTLVNALIAHCGASLSGIGGVRRPGIVHRLDKDTTGLMVIAKNDKAHQSLSMQFADHGRTRKLRRSYLAFVWGGPVPKYNTIDAPIDRHPHARERMAVRKDGRKAITHFEVLESFPGKNGKTVAALIACQLETGRTHQIRVHLAHLGHPLLGDDLYGPHFKTKVNQLHQAARPALSELRRHALHSYLLTLEHPSTNEVVTWESTLPADLARLQLALIATK